MNTKQKDELEFLPAALEIQETPPLPMSRYILWAIMLFFVIAVTWACIGEVDTVAFGSGLSPLDLMFSQSGDDLLVSNIGTTDTIIIQDWYLGSEYQTEIFRDSEGNTLMNTQVEQLIQAMAGFSAETGLNWSDAAQQRPEDIETILATSWQPAA